MNNNMTSKSIQDVRSALCTFDKDFKCPGCAKYFEIYEESFDQSVNLIFNEGDVVGLIHVGCEKPTKCYICLGCGKGGEYPSRLRQRCKCASLECEDGGGGGRPFEDDDVPPCSPPSNDTRVDCGQSSTTSDAHRHFSGDEWPERSVRYFLLEHEAKGNGKKGIVYRALIYNSIEGSEGLDELSKNETDYHMHIASVYFDMPREKIKDVCSMIRHDTEQRRQSQIRSEDTLNRAFCKSIVERFCKDLGHSEREAILQSVKRDVAVESFENSTREVGLTRVNPPLNHQDIRTKYVDMDAKYSIMSQLPTPQVGLKHGCAHIPAEQIVNHLLALGVPVDYVRAGHDEDWKDRDGNYDCRFTEELHKRVKSKMMMRPDEISNSDRVIVVRMWSDGFEAFHIKADNRHNNLQLFTLTIKAPNGNTTKLHTLPFALCFKKASHDDIFMQLLEEVHDMEKPTVRYFGKEKTFHRTMVFYDLVSNDYPERCANTCTSQNGTYTKRWGYSCKYDDKTTPSCKTCELDRVERILSPKSEIQETECMECLDWWKNDNELAHPPLQPAGEPAVDSRATKSMKLTFDFIVKSIRVLEVWLHSRPWENGGDDPQGGVGMTKATVRSNAEKYLQQIGFSTSLVKTLLDDLLNGVRAQNSGAYPKIFKQFRDFSLEIENFGSIPMHMCCLGVEKGLISRSPKLLQRSMRKEREVWNKVSETIAQNLVVMSSVSLAWCLSMTLSTKDVHEFGTANWQSDHYLSFTRLSLFHYAQLDDDMLVSDLSENTQMKIKIFKRIRVLWFTLMSSILGDEKVEGGRVGDLVRLFLSSCKTLTDMNVTNSVEADAADQPDDPKSKKKRRRKTEGTATKKKKKKDRRKTATDQKEGGKPKQPFFVSASNYLSLLNLEDTIAFFGPIRTIWEGPEEKYIQNVKREITNMRHNDGYLVTVLRKLLLSVILPMINENNPFSDSTQHVRSHNFRVYKSCADTSSIMQLNDAIVGVVTQKKELVVCMEKNGRNSGISLHRIMFDDALGTEILNLWYAPATVCSATLSYCKNREDVLNLAVDFFVMLKKPSGCNAGGVDIWTVICRSWRVRNCDEELALLRPTKTVLLME